MGGVLSIITAPAIPPIILVRIMRGNIFLSSISSSRYPPMLATEPGKSATEQIALEFIGGTPVKIKAGNAIKLPPPAIEFIAPAIAAERKSKIP